MRIISLLSSATEMLFALGLGRQVVAVSHECDWPPEVKLLPPATKSNVDSSQPSDVIDRQVKALLAAGETLYQVDRDVVEYLQPDLIVTQSQCDVCAVRHADVLRMVGDSAVLKNTRVVDLNPSSLKEVLADIRKVGEAAGVGCSAEEYIDSLRDRIDAVSARVVDAPRPRVAIVEWCEPLMLAGNWMPDLVQRAGGENLITRAGEHSPYVEWNDFVAANPDVVIVAPCGFDLARSRIESQSLLRRPEFANLKAVRNERAFVVDGNAYFNRSGPRLVESLEILGYLLHPSRVPPPRVAGFASIQAK